ncbi:hypothetical protein [Methanopyrus sp.]
MTVRVVLDANFLMIPHQEGVDVFSELDRLLGSYRPIVPRQVLEELERVERAATGRDRIAARVALSLVDAKGIEVVDVEGKDGDEAILNLARRWDRVYVATRDKELKKHLWELGVPVITLRQRTHLVIERG